MRLRSEIYKAKLAAFSKRKRAPRQLEPISDKCFARRLTTYKTNSKSKQRDFSISDEQARVLFGSCCHYCGWPPLNGIDRVDSMLGYVEGNVVACCSRCNLAKGASTVEEFTIWLQFVKHKQPERPIQGNRRRVLRAHDFDVAYILDREASAEKRRILNAQGEK